MWKRRGRRRVAGWGVTKRWSVTCAATLLASRAAGSSSPMCKGRDRRMLSGPRPRSDAVWSVGARLFPQFCQYSGAVVIERRSAAVVALRGGLGWCRTARGCWRSRVVRHFGLASRVLGTFGFELLKHPRHFVFRDIGKVVAVQQCPDDFRFCAGDRPNALSRDGTFRHPFTPSACSCV